MQKMLALTGNRKAGKIRENESTHPHRRFCPVLRQKFCFRRPHQRSSACHPCPYCVPGCRDLRFGVFEGLAVKAGSDKVQPQAASCGICVLRSGPVCVACELDQSACFERSRTCVAALRTIQPLKIRYDPDAEKWLASFK